jgi:hypothetical protein
MLKEVSITCGTKTKLIKIDVGNFDKTKDIIKKKFNLSLEFDIKVVSGEKGDEFDIDDAEDLDRFKDSGKFYARLRQPTAMYHREGATSTPPPSYEQSVYVRLPETQQVGAISKFSCYPKC